MSSENSVFLEQEKTSTALLNDILDQLKHIPNTTAVVNSINHLNTICVPMIGANKLAQQANGVSGFVPAPTITEAGKFLRGDGTWQTVITSIDPLKTESLVYPENIANATGYPFVRPSDAKNETVGTLKYNTNLRFGRHEVTIGRNCYTYTLLGVKQDNISTDAGIEFINSSSSGGSTILFANLSNSNIRVKMPQVDGTLLTDRGFTVNGDVVVSDSSLFVGNDAHGISITSSNNKYGSQIVLGAARGQFDENMLVQAWYVSSDSNRFSISFANTLKSDRGSLWIDNTEDKGTWHMSKNLSVLNHIASSTAETTTMSVRHNITINGNYDTYIARRMDGDDVVYHSTKQLDYIVYNSKNARVNLINKRSSFFYVNDLTIEPLNDNGTEIEGGELRLAPRQGESYGPIMIDNYNGMCRIWNDNDKSSILQIDSTKNNGYTAGSLIRAENFDVNAYSYMAVNGYIHLTNSSNGINLHADTAGTNHIDASVPMSSAATSTPTGVGQRWYRPIIIATTAPASSDTNNAYGYPGDVWIQYS